MAGSYTVTLTVIDNSGATAQMTRPVSASTQAPVSVAVGGRVTYERVPFSANLTAWA